MFIPFSSIAVFFHRLRSILCYLNVTVNIKLVLFQQGHKKKISKLSMKYFKNAQVEIMIHAV